MDKFSDNKIIDSWHKNAETWIAAVREGEIESRIQVTNQAIINTVLKRSPNTALDVGCGEGWLTRALEKAKVKTLGIDAVEELISQAQAFGVGRFRQLTYEQLSLTTLAQTFDVLVCNFSLIGHESVIHLFKQAPSLLNKKGAFIVQTVHPLVGCGSGDYQDGWREGSWDGFGDGFCDPAPWYFRTMESWRNLFVDNGFMLNEISEPMHPGSNVPVSVIFTGTCL